MGYILGLDVGETSIGIALLNEKDGEPVGLMNLGVRIFPDGREDKTPTPLAVKRRESRGTRRNRDRRLMREEKLVDFLIENLGYEKNKYVEKNPYELRARALNEQIELDELSRALIHINQRRGFKSNRKTDSGNDEASDMKASINETTNRIANKIENNDDKKPRTIGEYLYSLQKVYDHAILRVRPQEIQKTIKVTDKKTKEEKEKVVSATKYNYFPSRELYLNEVNLILNKQSEFYPQLKDLKDKIVDIIFHQRDLLPQDVAKCWLEENEYRAPKASPLFQKYRILCNLNNLELRDKDGVCLSEEEKNKIKEMFFGPKKLLQKEYFTQEKITFKAIRKELKLNEFVYFNLEKSREGKDIRDELEGDETWFEMRKYFKNWDDLSVDKKEEYVNKILSNEKDEEIVKYFEKENLELTDEIEIRIKELDIEGKSKSKKSFKKTEICDILNAKLPTGYANLSLKAIKKLLPHLENGKRYDEAAETVYNSHSAKAKYNVYPKLPYYGEILNRSCIPAPKSATNPDEMKYGKITNPTVHIGLNQLRKVINESIKKEGKPEYIVIELARDLKLNQKQKAALIKEQNKNTKDNENIDKILKENGKETNYDNRILYKIWERLSVDPKQRCCPFCGKQICISDLFNGQKFQIEHLLPYSKSYDDSINNKVIACSSCNSDKGNQTPFEAWGYNIEKYDEIMGRVANLPKNMHWRFNENAMKANMDNINKEFWKDDYFGKEKWFSFSNETKNKIVENLADKTNDARIYLSEFNLNDNQIDNIIRDFDKIAKTPIARMLTDTQYLSKAATEYLNCLFPDDKKVHVRVSPGKLTSLLRHTWGLNELISDDKDVKNRKDHRHHAIDAFVVACTTPKTLNKISKASGKASVNKNDKLIKDMAPPYEKFDFADIKRVVDGIIVSYRPDNPKPGNGKTTGQLHDETNLGLVKDNGNGTGIFATRKKFTDLEKKDLNIEKGMYVADEKIRKDLSKLSDSNFKEELEKYSKEHNIKKIRVHEEKDFNSLAKLGKYNKYAKKNGNYCAEIYMPNRGKNKDKWCVEIISKFDAHRKDFVSQWRKEEPEAKLIMRLFNTDIVEIKYDDNTEKLKYFEKFVNNGRIIFKVRKMGDGAIHIIPHNVANDTIDGKREVWTDKFSASQLQSYEAKKVKISPLGQITYLKK